jgi:hypothetical protein
MTDVLVGIAIASAVVGAVVIVMFALGLARRGRDKE